MRAGNTSANCKNGRRLPFDQNALVSPYMTTRLVISPVGIPTVFHVVDQKIGHEAMNIVARKCQAKLALLPLNYVLPALLRLLKLGSSRNAERGHKRCNDEAC